MRIVSLIQRPNGHSVRFGRNVYHFKPPIYTCDVECEAHAKKLLAIPEGYATTDCKTLDEMTKEDLLEYAENRGIKLDKRKNLKNLREEFEARFGG